ncbi:serine/threonine-protein kinase [Streptomyces sp. NPDC059708]|uniref:serine/threonine-protein kinase n=1 Tax=Streptomyces sp. NPDC059708 TaxID=3346916 RepID=UPI003682EE97
MPVPSEQANDGDLVGRALGGRYRVTSVIGRGGMGVVARAVDELLGREVAVKLLRAYTDAGPAELADLRTRMRREAQAAARIRHTGVVTVHDVTEEQGLPVIVMELVDGPSLDAVVERRGALDPYEAAAIGARLMDALDAAHRAGVLHRDVKPGNVLLERGGRVVLTDFGIASMQDPDDEELAKLTRSGEIVGSLDYLPPERAQGREPGPASDIWSLGMTLYAAVEGVSPFRRTSVWSTLSAIVAEPLPEAGRAGPLGPVLQALMAKDPDARPTADQARAMLDAVAAGAAGAGGVVPQPPAGVFGPTPTAPSAAPPGFGPPPAADESFPYQPYQPHQPHQPHPAPSYPPPGGAAPVADGGRARRRGRVAVAVAVVAVLGAGGAAYALTSAGAGKKTRTTATPPSTAPETASPGTPPGTASPGPSPSPSKSGPSPSASKKTAPPSAPASPSASAKPGPAPTGCAGWTHKDPKPGTYGFISGDHHLLAAPYQQCAQGALVKSGTKLWYHCYIVNSYGNQWTFVRVDGTNQTGWLYNRDLTGQKGSSPAC